MPPVKAKYRIASNPRARLKVYRRENSSGSTTINSSLTFMGGVDDFTTGRALMCDETLDLGTYHGGKLKAILKVWVESPLAEMNKRLRDRYEHQERMAALAKELVRKQVLKELQEEVEPAAPSSLQPELK